MGNAVNTFTVIVLFREIHCKYLQFKIQHQQI